MDELTYLNEIFALIVGILIGALPILKRFLLNPGGKTAEAAVKEKRAEGVEREKPRLLRIKEADLAVENGGGIYNLYSNPIVTNCIFSGNLADDNTGGGIKNTT